MSEIILQADFPLVIASGSWHAQAMNKLNCANLPIANVASRLWRVTDRPVVVNWLRRF